MWNRTFQLIADYWWIYMALIAGLLMVMFLWIAYEKRSQKLKQAKAEKETCEDSYKLASIVSGLGGVDNIYDLDCCTTRLRVVVNDGSLVDRNMLRSTGASGVLGKRRGVQIIYGTCVGKIKSELTAYLDRLRDGETDSAEEIYEEDERIIEKLYAPIEGDIIHLDNLPGITFEQDKNGDGIAIIPRRGELRSPFNGKITGIVKGRNQLTICSEKGIEAMIQIGSLMESLPEEAFRLFVKAGDSVRKGRLLAEFDLELLESRGYNMTSSVIVTNSADSEEVYGRCKENVNFEHVALVVRHWQREVNSLEGSKVTPMEPQEISIQSGSSA